MVPEWVARALMILATVLAPAQLLRFDRDYARWDDVSTIVAILVMVFAVVVICVWG